MKNKKKRFGKLGILVLALVFITAATVTALAFDSYAVLQDNKLQIVIKQSKASSTATVKYATGGWYLFPKEIKAADSDTASNYSGAAINASFYSKYGLALSNAEQETDSDDPVFRYDTFTYPASVVISKVNDWVDAGYFTREDLKGGITLQASRAINILKNGTKIGTVYSYPEMEEFSEKNHINWGANSWTTFYTSYDIPLQVPLQWVPFTIRVVAVDEEGNETDISAKHTATFGFPYSEVFYGETIATNYPGAITDYKYTGWELSAGSFKKSGSGTSVSYLADYNDIQGADLVLTFKYEKVKADVPFQSPTPEPTRKPGATATPTPTPTAVPTPAPPTATPQPSTQTEVVDMEVYYYSTDKGYHIGEIADSTTRKYALTGGTATDLANCSYLSRTNLYSVGKDANGNEWYFYPNGTEANLVHPKKYNGYNVYSDDIKYITELVYPSTITSGSTTYTVVDIGGGTAKYKTDKYLSTTYFTEEYGAINGSYIYSTWSSTMDGGVETGFTDSNVYILYSYGIMGNGYIRSEGRIYKEYYTTGGYDHRDYVRNYYVYNTTLKKVVIPDTVKYISEDAFMYCQALESIEGGAGLTSIYESAFFVNGYPEVELTSILKQGLTNIKRYKYYNEDYSETEYTETMLAWRAESFLSDRLEMAKFPKLQTICRRAFCNHHNLSEVDLSTTVTSIQDGAFAECKLDRIRIPGMSTSISNDVSTLGTKGYSTTGDTTQIHCEPDSTAMSYGLLYDGNYVLYCGYPVTYEPNGAQGEAQTVYSALNIHYGTVDDENGTRLTYPNYKQSNSDQYYYSSSDCQYQSYLDPEGVLWRLDTTNKTMTMVSPGTTFTELFAEGAAHFAYDSTGNLWVSGQQRSVSTYTDSWGDESFYSYYSSLSAWRKMTLPTDTVKTQITDRGVFALDSNGAIWWCKLSSNSNIQITNCTAVFTDFYFTTYHDDAEYNYNSYLAAIDAEGNLYRTYYYNSSDEYRYSAFCLENMYAWGGSTTANYAFEDDDFYVVAAEAVQLAFVQKGAGAYTPYTAVLLEDGSVKYYYWLNNSTCTSYTNYVFTEMESCNNIMGSVGLKLKDTAGNTYIAYGGTSTSSLVFQKVASAGVDIKEMWYAGTTYFSDSTYYGCEYEDGYYYHQRMYIWTDDGYLYACSGQTTEWDYDNSQTWQTSWLSHSLWKMADVKFKKVYLNYFSIFAIAEDGTLWSGGDNKYGQLGHAATGDYSYDYSYPSSNCSRYLLKTGNRTYTDVYHRFLDQYRNNWPQTVYALGTDGVVYRTGLYGGACRNVFNVAEEQTWPSSSSLPRLRTGYDYNTILVSNPFAYDGYSFTGWNTASGGTGTSYYPGDAVELSAALTVYAQWGRANNIIHYDANGGYGTMPNTVLDYAVTSTTLAANNFAKVGHTFAYWCRTDKNCSGAGASGHQHYADKASISGITGTVTLYAQWDVEPYYADPDNTSAFSYQLVYMKYPYGSAANTVWKSKTLAYETKETVEGQPYTPASGYTVTYNLNKPSGMSTTPTTLGKTSDTIAAPTFNKWRLYRANANGEYIYAGSQYSQGNTISKLTQKSGEVIYLYPTWNTAGSYVLLPYSEADGYVLNGWSESADGSSTVYPVYSPEDAENVGTFTPSKNTTLYGAWTPLAYDIALDGQSATTHTQTSVTMTFDAMCPSVTVPSRTRYIFMGYFTGTNGAGTQYYDKDGNGLLKWQISDGSVTNLYAHWVPDKAVSYDANGGTGSMDTSWVDSDKDYLDLPANAFTAPTGYHFAYWCQTAAGCTGESASGHKHWADKGRVTGITGRITLYAQWAPNNYTVTLNYNGGTKGSGDTSPYTVTYNANNYYDISAGLPTRTGYTFTGFYTAASGGTQIYTAVGVCANDGTYWKSNKWVYAGNVTLYAQWTANTYTVTLEPDGGQPTPAPTVKPTYDANMPSVNVPTRKYTVTFNANTGTCATTSLTSTYIFGGYFSGKNGTGTQYYKADGTSARTWNVAQNTTLYAKWTSVAITLPTATKTGYTFNGWYTAARGGTLVDVAGKSYTPSADITLYAHWTANTYTVTLEPDGGKPTPAPTVKPTYDSAMPSVNVPTRKYTVTFNANTGTCATTSLVSEYTFGGYFSGKDGTGMQYYKADGTSARTWNIAQNTTLYAKWTSKAVTLPTSTKTGYTFRGWYTAASGGTKVGGAGDGYTPTADITLYAQWKAKEYDIIFNDRGATSTNHTETVHMVYGEKGKDIITPTKTGYTFQGYYTGIRGAGKIYYGGNGICVTEWKEESVTELFAYWIQDEVLVPEEDDISEPTPLPEQDMEGNVGRNDAKCLLYADDYDDSTDALTDLQPYLVYDTDASKGVIPGTEKLSFRAKMGEWMLHYKLHRNTGTDYVRFYVTVPYRTQYERSEDEELVISARQNKTYTFLIPKVWNYWEIIESGMYYPEKVIVTSQAIKNTSVVIPVKRDSIPSGVVPYYDVKQYGDKTAHVFWENYDTDGYPVLDITLTEEQYIISDVLDTLPDIDAVLEGMCRKAARTDTRQARVRSDRFMLDGNVILSDEFRETGSGAELGKEAAESVANSGKIAETSYRQTYMSEIELDEGKPNGEYETSAEIIYIGDESNIDAPETVTVALTGINPIRIHTPVVCRGQIDDGLESTEEGYVLTLKDALNFFTLSVDNTGTHRMSFGYGTKNYVVALSGKSNLARQDGSHMNQIQFPFDVYVDVGNDSKRADGSFITDGDVLLPAGTWFDIGTEKQQFYVPVTMKNGEYQIKFRSVAANCPKDDAGQFIFGEEEYHANLSPSCYVAADVIKVEVRSYLRDFRITSANDLLAAEQLEKECQALTLKKGYGFSFELLTQGEFYGDGAAINIVPSFFWESEDGTIRREVKLYYAGELPEDISKICFAWEGEPVLQQYDEYKVILQSFIGTGFIPADILCVEKEFPLEEYAEKNTFSGREEFFLRDGYLIVHFDIYVESNEGVVYYFDKWQETELFEDAKTEGWSYIPGDIIRYDLSKSIADDYEIGGSE